jgi:hypothetical protein
MDVSLIAFVLEVWWLFRGHAQPFYIRPCVKDLPALRSRILNGPTCDEDLPISSHAAEIPPFTLMAWPVILAPPGPARNTAIAAKSSGRATPRCASFAAF